MRLFINKPIVKPVEQPKVTSKVPIPESYKIHDKITPIPDYTMPQTKYSDDSGSRMVKRKTILDISKKYSCIQIQFTDPLLNQQK